MTTQRPTDAAREVTLDDAVLPYVEAYEFRHDGGGGYIPDDADKAMLVDALHGFIAEHAATRQQPEAGMEGLWRERWYGSEPQKGSAIVDERGNLIAYFGGDEATHAATSKAVAAHNATRLAVPTGAMTDVANERARQISAEGWTPEHDDQHELGELAMAAALYAAPRPLHEFSQSEGCVMWHNPWPWFRKYWLGREQAGDEMAGREPEGDGRQKHDRRRQLVIAGALIVAEIERLDRAGGCDGDPVQ